MSILRTIKNVFGSLRKSAWDRAPKMERVSKHSKPKAGCGRGRAFNIPKHNRKHLRARTVRIREEAMRLAERMNLIIMHLDRETNECRPAPKRRTCGECRFCVPRWKKDLSACDKFEPKQTAEPSGAERSEHHDS